MQVTIFRADIHLTIGNSGFARHKYSFEPIAASTTTGCGGGVYGTATIDASDAQFTRDVPDGSTIDRLDDGQLYLFVPGHSAGFSAAELMAGCL